MFKTLTVIILALSLQLTLAFDCWDATSLSMKSTTKPGQFCQTLWSNGTVSVVDTCVSDNKTFSCCEAKIDVCNRVDRCNDFKRKSVILCSLDDFGCATSLLDGESICIGKTKSFESFESYKYFKCVGSSNCNRVSNCWNHTAQASMSCSGDGIFSCENILSNKTGVYDSTCKISSCVPSQPNVFPSVTCCYTNNCNKVVVSTTTTTTTTTKSSKVDHMHVGRLDNVVVESSQKGSGNSMFTNGASSTKINSLFTFRIFFILLIFLC